MSAPLPCADAVLPNFPAKALLLCEHAINLSTQCANGLRTGVNDDLFEIQVRKHTLIEELMVTLVGSDAASIPELVRATGRLRESLQTESQLMANVSLALQNELLTIGAAQRRLLQARRYDSADAATRQDGGTHLSVCG